MPKINYALLRMVSCNSIRNNIQDSVYMSKNKLNNISRFKRLFTKEKAAGASGHVGEVARVRGASALSLREATQRRFGLR